ncbi:hypothetical protein L484_010099 [Morus notabilis]|uniref:Uncharacterized protein n=1 Tax=Morus notabilis TaxID=981085 RepID=W9SBB2_9ROSA|nr:hypothetical protein L484_010099 [Morus notabilis]
MGIWGHLVCSNLKDENENLQYYHDYQYVLDDEGMPKKRYPDHWKGENGLYCAGLLGRGLPGISADATNIATDISEMLTNKAPTPSSFV